MTIDGGTISVVASDDGINCAGGSDTGSTDRMGADQFSSQDGVELNINGGTVTIDADGDGLDSNGNFTMAGGTVCVCGPTNGGNGALDYNGTATITGERSSPVVQLEWKKASVTTPHNIVFCTILVRQFQQTKTDYH